MNSIVQSVLDISSYFPWLVIILSFQQMHHYCYHKYLCKSHKETTRMTGERVAILLLLHLVNHSTKKVYHHHEPCHHRYHCWCQRPQNTTPWLRCQELNLHVHNSLELYIEVNGVCSTATAGITHRISFFSF